MGKRQLALRLTGLRLLVAGAVLSGIGCGSDPTEPPTQTPPTEPAVFGTLRVTVTTSGSYLPEGYHIGSNAGSYDVGPTDAIEIPDLIPGEYTIGLLARRGIDFVDYPPNCAVGGTGYLRTATVTAGEVTTVAYSVSCVTPTRFSNLIISTTTVGSGHFPNGYTVRIDNGDSLAIDIPDAAGNLTLAVPGLAPGVHSVFLTLPSSCSLQYDLSQPPPNPQNVTIDAYPEVRVHWQVVCF